MEYATHSKIFVSFARSESGVEGFPAKEFVKT